MSAYLDAELASLREAVRDCDHERLIRIIDHIRVEAGDDRTVNGER